MRVLVAIDGSASGALALDLVADIAWPVGTTVRVTQAIDTGSDPISGPWPPFAMVEDARLEAELRADAERNVAGAEARLERPGLTIESSVPRGRPASAIVAEAMVLDANLVVVGSRGHGTIESVLLGSVSAEVVDHASAPVLVARGRRIDRVVLAWDGSSCGSQAAAVLRAWPIFHDSAFRVVTVAEKGGPWWTGFPEPGSVEMLPAHLDAGHASRSERDHLAQAMRGQLEAAGLRAEEDTREGDAATEILAAARESEADLIVLGSHGRTGLARLVLGSVARTVLQHAPCSVLVVRERPA